MKSQKVLFYLFFSRNIELALHSFGYGLYITVDNKEEIKKLIYLFSLFSRAIWKRENMSPRKIVLEKKV